MYADQVEAQANRSVKDRLDVNYTVGSGHRRPVAGKRPREEDDKWEHDLFEDNGRRVSGNKLGVRDLRLKLMRKSTGQSVRGSVVSGAVDLREKLSGTLYSRSVDPSTVRPKPVTKVTKPPRKSSAVETPVPVPVPEAKISSTVSKKKSHQKVNSLDNFLESLGLEKYSITFQAEEVDMAALIHMTDEDLKALGIPMGPRKKILLELEGQA